MAYCVIPVQPEVGKKSACFNEQHGQTLTNTYDDWAVSDGNAVPWPRRSKARDRLAELLMLGVG
jgi:hypothetical protein